MKSYKWIESTGGPIIILPVKEMKNWSGCFSTNSIKPQEIIDAEDFLNPNETDYGKACQIEEYIGTVNFGKEKVIVLGGEPFAATCLEYNEKDILVVRWDYAESEEAVSFYLQSDEIKDWTLDEIINVSSPDYVMFDSAQIGFKLKEKDAIYFSLGLGEYQIKTCEYKPDNQTSLLLHKLEKS